MSKIMNMHSAVLSTVMVGLLHAAPSVCAENFGRLFSTPAERASLDYLRQTTKVPVLMEPAETSVEPVPAAPVLPVPISLQGYVKRSDGQKSTVWVNHQPMQENTSNSAVQVGKLGRDSNEVRLKVPVVGKTINLKAGQVYMPGSDSVRELNAHSTLVKEMKGAIGDETSSNSQIIQNDIH